jgi:hypothetical protein
VLPTIGKLFEGILHARIPEDSRAFLFRPEHSTSLQPAGIIEKVTRNFGEEWLSCAVFLDVAKAFNTDWFKGLVYTLTYLNFPS